MFPSRNSLNSVHAAPLEWRDAVAVTWCHGRLTATNAAVWLMRLHLHAGARHQPRRQHRRAARPQLGAGLPPLLLLMQLLMMLMFLMIPLMLILMLMLVLVLMLMMPKLMLLLLLVRICCAATSDIPDECIWRCRLPVLAQLGLQPGQVQRVERVHPDDGRRRQYLCARCPRALDLARAVSRWWPLWRCSYVSWHQQHRL